MKKDQILDRLSDIYRYTWLWQQTEYLKRILWYPILYRTTRRYHILDLRDGGNNYGVGWYDSDEQILQANFLILKNFVEKERPFDIIDFDHDEEHKKIGEEILNLYTWWKVERMQERKDLQDAWAKRDCSYHFRPSKTGFQEMVWTGDDNSDLLKREEELNNKDTEMLVRLVKIRRNLWT